MFVYYAGNIEFSKSFLETSLSGFELNPASKLCERIPRQNHCNVFSWVTSKTKDLLEIVGITLWVILTRNIFFTKFIKFLSEVQHFFFAVYSHVLNFVTFRTSLCFLWPFLFFFLAHSGKSINKKCVYIVSEMW